MFLDMSTFAGEGPLPVLGGDPISHEAVSALLGDHGTTQAPIPAASSVGVLSPQPARVPVAVPIGNLLPADATGDEPFAPPVPASGAAASRPDIERLLAGQVHGNFPDLHMVAGQAPRYRVDGDLLPISGEPPLTSTEIEALVAAIAPGNRWAQFQEEGDLDFAHQMKVSDGAAVDSRFRVNVFRSTGQTGVDVRAIPSTIPSWEDLGLLPQIARLSERNRGLVLICGETGSGKSTTTAAALGDINARRNCRIITFEDPVEFVHTSKRALISHREIGVDTPSFAEGLRRVRRQDPNVILVGEMRDHPTMKAALEAAEQGHLVFATLHSKSAAETINRIINSFPGDEQNQIRTTLASVLEAVVCQTLVKAKSGQGRVAATEVMIVNPAITNGIRMNDTSAIESSMTDTSTGSMLRDAHLAHLVKDQRITRTEAYKAASSQDSLSRYLDVDPSSA